MKGEHALDIIKDLGNELPKVESTIFEALVDDTKKMEHRMTALEKTVAEVKSDVREVKGNIIEIQSDLKNISKQIDSVINQKQSFWKFLSALIKEQKFWIWFIIVTLLFFGVTETDLFNVLKIGG